jgi:NTE family protein
MLRALTERDIQPDVVVGCSVGALNGAAFAAQPSLAGVRRLDSMWRSITTPDLLPSTRIPNALLLIRKGESLYRNDALRRTVENALDGRSRFDELEIPFQCVATEVDGAAERYFSEGPLIDPILASAALPSVYPIVEIEGRRYLDGGVINNVPVARAVELGAKRIYVLHVGLHGRPEAEVKRPIDAALIAYWIARNSRLARDLAQLPRSVEAIVLPPGDRPELRYDDFTQTADLIDQGYLGASQYLDELAEAEASEPRLAERLRREMFRTAEWRHRRRPARDTDPDVVPEAEPASASELDGTDSNGAEPSDLPAQSGT